MAAGAAAWFFWPRTVRIDATDRALIARGEPLYRQHCASCHGARLEGQPNWQSRNARGRLPAPPHDDSGHTWHHDDEVLFEVTKYGIARHAPAGYQSDMPGFGGALNDADIVATLGLHQEPLVGRRCTKACCCGHGLTYVVGCGGGEGTLRTLVFNRWR